MNNKFQKIILTAAVFSLLTFGAQAQSKVATIDLRKVFDKYYKTVQADAALKEEANDLEKERKDMVDNFKKGELDWQKLKDKSADQALSAEEREKSKQAAEKKFMELKDTEQAIGEFERSARAKLNEKQLRKRNLILDEIRPVINEKAKSGGYSLVIDTAGESVNNTPVVLYSSGQDDLTDAILTQLNAAAPKTESKAETKPADAKPDEKKK